MFEFEQSCMNPANIGYNIIYIVTSNLAPHSTMYHIHTVLRIRIVLDKNKLKRCLSNPVRILLIFCTRKCHIFPVIASYNIIYRDIKFCPTFLIYNVATIFTPYFKGILYGSVHSYLIETSYSYSSILAYGIHLKCTMAGHGISQMYCM